MAKVLNPEKIFVLFALFFGFLMVFLIPPFQSPDETAHLCRAYGISRGQFFPQKVNGSVGSFLPENLLKFLKASTNSDSMDLFFAKPVKYSPEKIKLISKINIDNNKTIFTDYANMARLSPISYLPQSTGILVASLFSKSIFWILIAGKIVTLLFYTLLGYYSIKSIPFLKWACVFWLLCPMSLSLGASISADAVLISVSVLYISKIFQYSFDTQQKINNKQLALLSLLAVSLALTKQSFLMTLFILFIPKEKFETPYLKTLCFTILLPFAAAVLWSLFALTILRPLNGSDFSSHMLYILEHPVKFTALTLQYIPGLWNFALIEKMIGVLGWLNIYFCAIFYHLYFVMILANTLYSVVGEYPKTTFYQKAVLGVLTALNYLSICVLIFCTWTQKNQFEYIEIQGRYLLPFVLPFLAFCIMVLKPLKENQKITIFNILFLFSALLYVIFELFKVFY